MELIYIVVVIDSTQLWLKGAVFVTMSTQGPPDAVERSTAFLQDGATCSCKYLTVTETRKNRVIIQSVAPNFFVFFVAKAILHWII